MICPLCKLEMEPGEVFLRSTFAGFLFFGWSYKHCYFEPSNSNAAIKALDNSERKPAHHCGKCGMIAFRT